MTMIDLVYDELLRTGFVSSRSQFSREWLGKNEAYMRNLTSKHTQPSIKVLATCACSLQNKGDSLVLYGDLDSKSKGKKLKKLARKCFDEILTVSSV
jgi:hypothetical protein